MDSYFALFLGFSVLLGLVLGSGAAALAVRALKGEAWGRISGKNDRTTAEGSWRSHCVSCGAVLRIPDLVPVLSWIFLKGACRYCRQPVSRLYPVVELTVMLAVVGIFLAYGLTARSLLIMLSVPFLASLFIVDMKSMILPDRLQLVLFFMGLFYVLLTEALLLFDDPDKTIVAAHILGAVVFGAVAWGLSVLLSVLLKKDALGMGDVKFFGIAGLWLGASWLAAFMIVAGVAGVVWGGIARFCLDQEYFPFGPSLIAAFYICLVLQGIGMDGLFGYN